MTPTNDRKSGELYAALVVMVIAITAASVDGGPVAVGRQTRTKTGDIIAFPATQEPSVSTASFAAGRAIAPNSMSCILDVKLC